MAAAAALVAMGGSAGRSEQGGEPSKSEARLSVSARRRRGGIGDNPRRARTETAPRGEAE